MTYDELSKEQKLELKRYILMERNEHIGEGTSYGELALADDLVSDEVVEAWAEGVEFSEDDFTADEVHDERDWEAEALKYAESIGVYEYKVNGRFIEYWTFYGPSDGWYFVRYDLRESRERFRGANIPWDDEVPLPAPGFLRTKDGATKYNYAVG